MIRETFRNKYYDCYAANIITVANYYNRNYYMLFADDLYFSYNNTGNSIADKLIVFRNANIDEYILRFHCIELQRYLFESKWSMIKSIKQLLSEGSNLLLYTDVYYCSWNVLFLQSHISHVILIVGYDNKNFICLDPYFTQELLFISEDSEVFCKWSYKEIKILKEEATDVNSSIKVLKYNINKQDIQKSLRNFANDISKIDILKELENGSNIYNIPLIRKIKIIEDKRMSYLELLNAIKINFSYDLEKVEKNLLDSVHNWNRLRMLLFKSFITQNIGPKQNDIIKLIYLLLELEIKIYRNLIEYYNSFIYNSEPKL